LVPKVAGSVGPWVLTHDYAQNRQGAFLLGVVYHDTDGNGFYSIGEGIPGVTVKPRSGTYYAITSISGGYAIPMNLSNSLLTVTFSGGLLTNDVVCTVLWKAQSLKLDLETISSAVWPSLPYLTLDSWTRTLDGGFAASLSLGSSKRAVFQVSTDLVSWQSLQTNASINGVIRFSTVRGLTSDPQFYRALLLP
jgi:hypothetical protein